MIKSLHIWKHICIFVSLASFFAIKTIVWLILLMLRFQLEIILTYCTGSSFTCVCTTEYLPRVIKHWASCYRPNTAWVWHRVMYLMKNQGEEEIAICYSSEISWEKRDLIYWISSCFGTQLFIGKTGIKYCNVFNIRHGGLICGAISLSVYWPDFSKNGRK